MKSLRGSLFHCSLSVCVCVWSVCVCLSVSKLPVECIQYCSLQIIVTDRIGLDLNDIDDVRSSSEVRDLEKSAFY